MTDGFDDTIHTNAIREFEHSFDRVTFIEIESHISPQFFGGFQTEGLQIGDDGYTGADAVAEHIQNGETELTSTE